MQGDKYSAVWVSYSSISDFLRCPRLYFLKNVYRSPGTGHKIKLMSPPLALGLTVHDVLESISVLPTSERFRESLVSRFDLFWTRVSGKLGGFLDEDIEQRYKRRGERICEQLMGKPGVLSEQAVKIKKDLPYYWLSEKEGIILCGRIDWLSYIKESDSVHIIDFKTSSRDEDPKSLQLPIYFLLASSCQQRKVTKASYWYLERENGLIEQPLPHISKSYDQVMEVAQKIKLARQLRLFKCLHKTGCSFCSPYDAVLQGSAEFVGINRYGEDVFVLEKSKEELKESVLL